MTAESPRITRRRVLGAGAAAAAVAVAGAGSVQAEPATTAAPGPSTASPMRPRRSPRLDIVCGECGGNNVMRDAWAVWDVDEQDWVLGAVFDYGHCDDCDGESRLEEIELAAEQDD